MTPTRESPAVELRDVRKAYVLDWTGRRRPALTGVSLRVAPGSVVALAGANGSGKTTLLRLCAGLTGADAGNVGVLGGPAREARGRGRLAFLGDGEVLPPHLTARECLRGVAAATGADGDGADAALEEAGLAAEAATPVGALSRGRRQRLALAAVALGPAELVLLDEPASGLDPHAARRLAASLRRFGREGRTVLFSSHFLAEAEDGADRVVLLAAGRVAWEGDAAAVARRGGLAAVYREEVPE